MLTHERQVVAAGTQGHAACHMAQNGTFCVSASQKHRMVHEVYTQQRCVFCSVGTVLYWYFT